MSYYGHEVINSKAITESAVVTTANKVGILYGITLLAGTSASAITISNGGSGGTAVWKLTLKGETAAGDTCASVTFPRGIICSTDIYATLAGTGAVAYVAYKEIEA